METSTRVLGRDAELAEIRRFVDATPDGPGGLVLVGTAGIGKTTLWQESIRAAELNGFEILVTRAAESEATLSYSALSDLLERVADGDRAALPEPQQRALDAALLRSDVAVPDQRAVSLAALGIVRALASRGAVVIAIDDVQWLDAPSSRALTFLLRRLRDEPVHIVASLRLGPDAPAARVEIAQALGDARVRRVDVGPLNEDAMGRVLRARTGDQLNRSDIVRIHKVTGGNALFALEIARAISDRSTAAQPGEQLPVPEDLRRLLAARVAGLPATAEEPLLVIACLTKPTVDLVVSVADEPDAAREGLAAAEAANVVTAEHGRLRFSHPLLGSAVSSRASAAELRDVHRKLALQVTDLEERARHLALATEGPAADVAAELDRAARHARARGAPDAAAELSMLALDRTPPGDHDARRQRRLDTADYRFDAGDAPLATELLRLAAEETPHGVARAEILYRLSSMSWMNLERGVRAPLLEALSEAEGDAALLAGIRLDLAWVDIYQGDLDAALAHARASVDHATASDDGATNADALASRSMVEFLRGADVTLQMQDAIALQDAAMEHTSWTEASVYTTPRSILGLQLMWAGELETARGVLEHELAEYERLGMYTLRQEVLCYLAELACRAGRFDVAAAYAAEAAETVEESGMAASQTHVVRFNQALAASYLGEVDEARRLATEGLALARENDDAFNGAWNAAVLGSLELSLGRFDQVHQHLAPVLAYLNRMDPAEPGVIPCVPDAIEALIALGELDAARDALKPFAEKGRAKDRPWAVAAALRCEGALAAAEGDIGSARQALERATAQHVRASQPFEAARTAMVRGIVERRAKQKRAARDFLRDALVTFEELGARSWAARAEAELARAGGDRDADAALTPTEERVAQLVAEGKTNREVADALFVSVKTVESNLTRIFHKLGIRSRADLIRRAAHPEQADA